MSSVVAGASRALARRSACTRVARRPIREALLNAEVGLEDDLAAHAVDDDGHAGADVLDEVLHPGHQRQPKGARHQGRVRGLAAALGEEAADAGAAELGDVGRGKIVREDHGALGHALVSGRGHAEQVAQDALADHVDVAAAFAEVGILDAGEDDLDLVQGAAQGPFRRHLIVADDLAGFLHEVNVGQHHTVGFQDAVFLAVAYLLGDLLLDAAKLGIAACQGVLEAAQLLIDLVGEDAPLLHLDAAAEKVRDAHGDAGRCADTGQPNHRRRLRRSRCRPGRPGRPLRRRRRAPRPRRRCFRPQAATRVKRPMMLLPLTLLPSLMTRISDLKWAASWTNFTAARACMPARLRILRSWRATCCPGSATSDFPSHRTLPVNSEPIRIERLPTFLHLRGQGRGGSLQRSSVASLSSMGRFTPHTTSAAACRRPWSWTR